MESWKDLQVQVNGSFYCVTDQEDQGDSGEATDWANGPLPAPNDEPIYLNTIGNGHEHLLGNSTIGRTIVRVGHEVEPGEGGGGDAATSVSQHQHTIKLVIGEPLSLDTSEYVSWDGGSQTGADQSSPSTDGCSVLDEDCDSISPVTDSSSSRSSESSGPSKAPLVQPPIHSDPIYNDELTHSCCRFFAERQLRHLTITEVTPPPPPTRATKPAGASTTTWQQDETHSSGLDDKMRILRREIVSV